MNSDFPLTDNELKNIIEIFENIWSCEVKYDFDKKTKELTLYDSSIPGEYCKTFSNNEIKFFKTTGFLVEDFMFRKDKEKYNYYKKLTPYSQEKYIEKYITKFLKTKKTIKY